MTVENFLANYGYRQIKFSVIFNNRVTMKLIGDSRISVYGKLRKDSLICNDMTVDNFHEEVDNFKFMVK